MLGRLLSLLGGALLLLTLALSVDGLPPTTQLLLELAALVGRALALLLLATLGEFFEPLAWRLGRSGNGLALLLA